MTTAPSGAGAAADLFGAVNVLTGFARAGGIRLQQNATLTLDEGFKQQAAAVDAHGKWLQETGRYPSDVWEAWLLAAAALRVAAARMSESGAGITSIMRTPGGEMNGRAPHQNELNAG